MTENIIDKEIAHVAQKISLIDKFMSDNNLDEHKCEVILRHNGAETFKFKNQMLYRYDGRVIRIRAIDADFIRRWFSSDDLFTWCLIDNVLIYTKDKKEPTILKV